MRTLYFDCAMGAAGDMLTAALLELFPDREAVVAELNRIGIPTVKYAAYPAVKCGITGTAVRVTVDEAEEGVHSHADPHPHDPCHEHDHPHDHDHDHANDHPQNHDHDHDHGHEHHHSGMAQIEHLVKAHLALQEPVKADVLAVYGLLAEAESQVHGVPIPEIHFHEVGTMDAVADIAAVCTLIHRLAPDRIAASPIHVGSGQVRCAHGLLPVPAPATALLLRGVPIYGGSIPSELCTPTGAALLRHFVQDFGPMPPMRVQAIGYGMGRKDFEAANCVRAMLGESAQQSEEIYELACNVDDMTGEAVGFAMEALFAAGALDVYTVGIGMKKSRPGILLRVLCKPEDRQRMVALLFRHTTTLGIREFAAGRYVLDRTVTALDTPFGTVRRKDSSGYGITRHKYEYEDLARIARAERISLTEAAARLDEE